MAEGGSNDIEVMADELNDLQLEKDGSEELEWTSDGSEEVECKSDDSGPKGKKTTFRPRIRCLFHDEERFIEMLCESHEMVYCSYCIATEHRSCQKVTQLADWKMKFKKAHIPYLPKLLEDVQREYDKLQENKLMKKLQLEDLKDRVNDINDEIEELFLETIERLETLKLETVDDLMTLGKQVSEKGKSDIQLKDKIMKMQQVYVRKMCFYLRKGKFRIASVYLIMLKDAVKKGKLISWDSNYASLDFTASKDLKISKLGEISYTNKEFLNKELLVLKSVKVMKINRDTDKHYYIIDICQFPDGTLFVADKKNNTVKRLFGNFVLRDSCSPCVDNIKSICCVGDKVIVLARDNLVCNMWISVRQSLEGGTKDCFRLFDHFNISEFCVVALRIDYVDGFLWISNAENEILVINTTFTNTLATHKFLLKNIYKIHWHGDFVYIADGQDGVLRVTTNGKEQLRIQDERLDDVRGVCTDKNGLLFVSGYRSNNVLAFSYDGICKGEVVSAAMGLRKPLNLHYDITKDCLLVCRDGYFPVIVFEFEWIDKRNC